MSNAVHLITNHIQRAVKFSDLIDLEGKQIAVWQEGHLNAPYESVLHIEQVDTANNAIQINSERVEWTNSEREHCCFNSAEDLMWFTQSDALIYQELCDQLAVSDQELLVDAFIAYQNHIQE